MSKVLVTKSKLDNLAVSVSTKSGESLPLTIDEMKTAVDSITGGTATLETVTKSYTPTESQQTDTIEPSSGYDGIGEVDVTVGAISPSYVGSGITRRSSSDLAVSGADVTAPAGYYASSASATIPWASMGNPTATKGTVSNHSVSVTPSFSITSDGYVDTGDMSGTAVSVSASELVSGDKSITSNGTNIDVTNYATVSVAVPSSTPNLQTKTNINPLTSSQTISADNGYDGLASVQINAMPSMTLPTSASSSGSGTTKATISRSTSDQYINIPTGYNGSAANYKVSAVANGTAGTPTATKGTVSNHSVSVTPSVTNTTGYITGDTKTGTAVTVSASELVSGSETKTANGTYDVTNLASLVVNVSGGGSGGLTLLSTNSLGTLSTSSTSATDTGKNITVTNSAYLNYDLLLVDVSVNSTTNNRHTSTVSLVYCTGTSNVSTKGTYAVGSNKWNSKLNSSGTGTTRQSTTAYGIYANSATVSGTTMTIPFYYRYNSNNTGTINGTYTARVYGIKLYDLIGG